MNLKAAFCCLGLFALFSCKKNVTVNIDSDLIFAGLSDSVYVPYGGFYQSPLQADSTFICLYAGDKRFSYFYSDTLNRMHVSLCKLNGEVVDTLKTVLLLEDEWSYLTIDSASFRHVAVHDEPYLYFSSSEGFMGQGVIERNVNFHLVNINTLDNFRLLYAGEPSFKCEDCIEGNFVETNQLRETPDILNLLKELSKTSRLIYQRGPKDENVYYHLNYQEKWDKDNQSHNSYATGHGNIISPIHSTYYKTNLFDLNQGSENSVIENSRYLFRSYFRGNIIGYDKEKKLYFPLYIENCVLGCNKDIEFAGSESIRVTWSESEEGTYLISINNIIFDSKTGD